MRSILEDLKDREKVDSLPWIVVEEPRNHEEFVKFYRKRDNQKLPAMCFGVRDVPLSDQMGYIATYILIAPSRRQVRQFWDAHPTTL